MGTTTPTNRTLLDAITAAGTPAVPGTETGAGFQLGIRHRPDAVVTARTADDVRAAVRAAAAHGVPVTVHSTGHGTRDAARGGVLIDVGHLDGITIDPTARTVRVEAGVRWGAVVEAAQQHDLTPPSGSFPGVGAIGYVFGGGIALTGRSDGWAADHVRSFETITPDGAAHEVTADTDPDAFARLRGTGPLPGEVVTAMTVGLLPAGPLVGGALVHDLGPVGEPGDATALHAFAQWTRDLPEEITAGLSVVPYPDWEVLPAHLRGRRVARIAVVVRGDTARADRLLSPLRTAAAPLEDTIAPLRPVDGHRVHAEPTDPHAYAGDNVLVDELTADGLDGVAALGGPMTVVGIRHLGGALGRLASTPDTVEGRDASYLVGALSPLDPESAVADGAAAVTDVDPARALRPFATGRVGTNRGFALGPRAL